MNNMISVKIEESWLIRQIFNFNLNNESPMANLDLLSELRDKARIRDEACKIWES